MPLWMIVIEWFARLILLFLVFLSIWSITIIIDRYKYFKTFKLSDFIDKMIAECSSISSGKKVQYLSKFIYSKKSEFEKGLSILGTLGSTTPFIGLLGTILGIIVAFGELSQGKSDTNAIMFALAEALILTAVGLFVAIPAVVAFNIFTKKIKSLIDQVYSELDHYTAKLKDE